MESAASKIPLELHYFRDRLEIMPGKIRVVASTFPHHIKLILVPSEEIKEVIRILRGGDISIFDSNEGCVTSSDGEGISILFRDKFDNVLSLLKDEIVENPGVIILHPTQVRLPEMSELLAAQGLKYKRAVLHQLNEFGL